MGRLWDHSGQVERDNNDNRATGALAYFYQGGTTTPFTVYEDADQNTARTNPVEADSSGRWPTTFVPFTTSYDVKVVTSGGTQLYYQRLIPNPDPVTASSASITASQLMSTGDIKFKPSTGTIDGWVRCNGRTIGSSVSGATERANDDTQTLFEYLWNNFPDSLCPVSTGRGGSAVADFSASKAIGVFDLRASGLLGVDDMGSTAASRLGSTTFTSGSSTLGGSTCGETAHVLTTSELASHNHSISDPSHTHTVSDPGHAHSISDPGHTHIYAAVTVAGGATLQAGASPVGGAAATSGDATGISIVGAATGITNVASTTGITVSNNGSSAGHNNVQRSILGTWYMKL